MYKTKVAVVGPTESGKTRISNYLSGATEISGGEYKPTQGVRILEFESNGENHNSGSSFKAEVELWDCSGNSRFESCWPAFAKDTAGVLIIYNPDKLKQEAGIEKWYTYFVKQQHLQDSQCFLVAHSSSSSNKLNSSLMSAVKCVHVNLDEDPEGVDDMFLKFLANVCSGFKETQDKVEQVIVNQQKL